MIFKCAGCGKEYARKNSLTVHAIRSKGKCPKPEGLEKCGTPQTPQQRKRKYEARRKRQRQEARKDVQGVCCGVLRPASITSWQRHKKAFPECGEVKPMLAILRDQRREQQKQIKLDAATKYL